jgi:N-acetyltransferase
MDLVPTTLRGVHATLEPLDRSHEQALNDAANDGELWRSTVTTVPSQETMPRFIETALSVQRSGTGLPFVIVQNSTGKVVGTTRFYQAEPAYRTVEIGYTWLAKSAQRTGVNTDAKLLLLTHAFETWRCIRVSFITNVLNHQSRNAILRLGAKEEGVMRNHMIMPDGRYRDTVLFSIIESEWSDVKARLESKLGSHKTA